MSLLDTASLIVTPNGYKEGTLYSVIPSDGSGDMSVVRATTATRVNSAGLVELVPYNLLTWSEAFDNADWLKFGSITANANATTSPNGIASADSLIPQAVNGTFAVAQPYTKSTEPTSYTFSGYAKSFGYNFLILRIDQGDSNGVKVAFNINTGIISTAGATNGSGWVFGSANIVDAQNGWYRFSISFTTGSNTYLRPIVYVSNATGDGFSPPSYTANGTSGVYIWGAELNEGTIKDYQKTETRLNIPRLDYSNGTCPSLLVEPQRTNVLRYSEDFTNGVWGLYSSGTGVNPIVTANTTISPSGILNADTIVLNAGAGTTAGDQSQIYQTFPITNGNVYTFSFYAKGSVGGEQLMIRQAAGGSYTKITLTNQWARYQVTETASYSGTGFLELLIRRGLNEPINASATFYAWGSQIEQATYPTSYIPTTSASVTRNADVVSKTGISSLIGQTEGTLFVEVYNYNNFTSTSSVPFSISSGSFGNAVYFEVYQNLWYASVFNGFNAQFQQNAGTLSIGLHKLAIAYKANDIAYYVDGNLIASSTSGTIPTCSRADIGTVGTSTTPEEMQVKATALWKTRLTNTQLAQLTTI
jgi:hypothetical protein